MFFLGYVHTKADSFSCRHQKLFAMVWIPFLYVTLHFRDRRDAASLRHKNRAKITVMSEQKQYPVWFLCLREIYPVQREHSLVYMVEKKLSLKTCKPWPMRLQGLMGIWSLAKQIQSSFKKVYTATRYSCGCKSLEYFVYGILLSFFVFQDSF